MSMADRQRTEFRLTGKHVLFGLIGAFGVIFLVNGIFLTKAIQTFPGLETQAGYKYGLKFNERIAEAERQAALDLTLGLETAEIATGRYQFVVTAQTQSGESVGLRQIEARLMRPADIAKDVPVTLTPAGGAGRFAAAVDVPLRGQWDFVLGAETADGAPVTLRRRIWLD
ncbi:MAG: FixH family protein [Alphaproteobacteria bacterium]|nr:FixH family protein [Alphaproteobacteria bacterium]MDX5369779.1 FixH family protein [Alphaproteobacteria bacterium]MDX5464403.1 FixH family protein [Alphaproteobacteria bacterium]